MFHKRKRFRANMAENVTKVYDVTRQMGGAFKYAAVIRQRSQALRIKNTQRGVRLDGLLVAYLAPPPIAGSVFLHHQQWRVTEVGLLPEKPVIWSNNQQSTYTGIATGLRGCPCDF